MKPFASDEEKIFENFTDKDDDFLFEMANYRQTDTGLPMIIWVLEKGKAQHGPRIKVNATHSRKMDIDTAISVTVDDNPRCVAGGELSRADLKKVRKFIELNKEAILDYWHYRIGGGDFVARIKKIS